MCRHHVSTRGVHVVVSVGCVAIMGPQEEYIEMVLTCEGDYYDPNFHVHLEDFSKRLQNLIVTGEY